MCYLARFGRLFWGTGNAQNNCPYKLLLSFTPFQLTKDFTGTFYFGIMEKITNVKILLTVMELLYRAYMSVTNSQMRGKKIHGNNNLLSLPLLFCCVSTSKHNWKKFWHLYSFKCSISSFSPIIPLYYSHLHSLPSPVQNLLMNLAKHKNLFSKWIIQRSLANWAMKQIFTYCCTTHWYKMTI